MTAFEAQHGLKPRADLVRVPMCPGTLLLPKLHRGTASSGRPRTKAVLVCCQAMELFSEPDCAGGYLVWDPLTRAHSCSAELRFNECMTGPDYFRPSLEITRSAKSMPLGVGQMCTPGAAAVATAEDHQGPQPSAPPVARRSRRIQSTAASTPSAAAGSSSSTASTAASTPSATTSGHLTP